MPLSIRLGEVDHLVRGLAAAHAGLADGRLVKRHAAGRRRELLLDQILTRLLAAPHGLGVSAIDLLAPDGILNIAVYPGHEEGEAEGKMICDYLSGISRHKVCATLVKIINSPPSPFFIMVETKPRKD